MWPTNLAVSTDVAHVLLRCPSIEEKRKQVREELREEGELSVLKLLYSKKGMMKGAELWGESVKLRSRIGDEIRIERGYGYGWDNLERNG